MQTSWKTATQYTEKQGTNKTVLWKPVLGSGDELNWLKIPSIGSFSLMIFKPPITISYAVAAKVFAFTSASQGGWRRIAHKISSVGIPMILCRLNYVPPRYQTFCYTSFICGVTRQQSTYLGCFSTPARPELYQIPARVMKVIRISIPRRLATIAWR